MELVESEFVNGIFQLLPGFVAAWIFYSLSSYRKPETIERIIQALIFTVITKVFVSWIYWLLTVKIVNIHDFGEWDQNVELMYLVLVAVTLGIVASWCTSNDFPHSLLRKEASYNLKGFWKFLLGWLPGLNITNKTIHPSEWYSFFKNPDNWAVLHLEGERRLLCIIRQFPDTPHEGHFICAEPAWILDDGTIANFPAGAELLINVKEFIRAEIWRKGYITPVGENPESQQPVPQGD